MSTRENPTSRRVDGIAAHIYTLPSVQELPIRPPAHCWDATW